MPKRTKTRKEKIIAETRHRAYVPAINTSTVNPEIPTASNTNQQESTRVIKTSSYSYLSADLWKTIILTTAIVTAELLIAYFKIGA